MISQRPEHLRSVSKTESALTISSYLSYARGCDPGEIIARARQLGVNEMSLYFAAVPGFQENCVLDPVALREIVGRLDDAKIRVPAMMNWLGGGYSDMRSRKPDHDLTLNPSAHRREIDGLLASIETMADLGVETLFTHIDTPAMLDTALDEPMWEGLISIYRELVALAELRGTKIANHAIWMAVPKSLQEEARARNVSLSTYRSFRMPGWRGPYLLADAGHVARLIEAVPSPNNGACVCTGMYMMGDDPIDAVRWFGRKIFFVQIRDLRGRWPLSEPVFPGSGEVDFSGLLETIVASGYRGTVHVEHLGRERFAGEDLETAALEYLRPLVEKANARR